MKVTSPRKSLFVVFLLLLPLLALSCQLLTPERSQLSAGQQPQVTEAVSAPSLPPVSVTGQGGEEVLVELYRRVNPSVVNITIYEEQNNILTPASQGSGFVYDDQGHIVTNAHVVHGAAEVEVTFADGSSRTAEIVGEDLHSDLAVVKVDNMPEEAKPLPLGNMENLAVGQTVVAIGNPFGLQGTLTRGVISALGRTIPALTSFSIPQSIQTDAAINPGNSGGPLLNLQGEVIGVNAQIETGGVSTTNLGIGFAVPVSIVRVVVPDLVQKGRHEWAWLGVRGGDVTSILAKAMDLPVEKGAYLVDVLPNGPSARAGLRGAQRTVVVDKREIEVGGDVITAIDDQPVNNFDDLLVYISLETHPGQVVTLTILRDGEYKKVKVTLEERPASLQGIETPN